VSRYYQDIKSGDTLRAGYERLEPATDIQRQQWQQISAASYGNVVSRHYLSEYRRPVDLPVLQPVTPEAMRELEAREAMGVLFVYGYDVQIASYNSSRGWWWAGGIGVLERPTRGWFIELSKLKEVQQ
jgi:hypothetical protein